MSEIIYESDSKEKMLKWLKDESKATIKEIILSINNAPESTYQYTIPTNGTKEDLLDELNDIPKKAIWYGINEVFPDNDEYEDEDEDEDEIEKYSGNYTLYKHTENPKFKTNFEVLNLDINPEHLLNKIKNFYRIRNKKEGFQTLTILNYGNSGTGKTHFAKAIANESKKDLIILSASSFLNRYVGETERNISYIFQYAEENDYIIFIDEIEGLTRSRKELENSHDFTQVNELLIRMENFKGVCIGATNLADKIDDAFTRRFILKVKFSFLSEVAKTKYFNERFSHILKNKLSQKNIAKLNNMDNLSIGDFESVYKRLILDASLFSADEIICELAKESSYKIINHN